MKKKEIPPTKTSIESSKDSSLIRIRSLVAQKIKHHKEVKQDWYCGKFLVRGANNRSELDSFLKEKVEVNPYPDARMLSGWMHLNRFYKLCRKPLLANLQKGWGHCIDPIWRIIYPCSFFVTITRSPEGVNGSHTLILWYSSSFKRNFAIAAATFDGHFNRDAPTPMIERIKELRLTQKFFQSESSQLEKIPM